MSAIPSRCPVRLATKAAAAVQIEGLEDRRLFAYSYVDLAPGVDTGHAYGVNNNGSVVGELNGKAAYWQYNAATGQYATIPLAITGHANDLDSAGKYVVGVDTAGKTSTGAAYVPFYVVNGKRIALTQGGQPLDESGTLNAVNDSGVAVGSFDLNGGGFGQSQAFTADATGKVTVVATPEGYTGLTFTGINNKGQIFGTALDYDFETASIYTTAFIYSGGKFTFLPLTPGVYNASVSTKGIDANGNYVANDYSAGKFADDSAHVAVSNNRSLGNDDGNHPGDQLVVRGSFNASDLNDSDTVVGTENVPGTDTTDAVVSLADGTLVRAAAFDGSSTAETADAINNNGWFVGQALDPAGGQTPYVVKVTPDAPKTFTLTGTLFNDGNGNGTRDSNDGVTGVRTVFLDANGNGVLDKGETSTQSNAAGVYTFSGLKAGTYQVSRVFPAGYRLSNGGGAKFVTATIGNANASGVDIGTTNVPVPVGPVTIKGTLFNDSNANGIFDRNEVGTGVRTVFIDANHNNTLDAGETSVQSDSKGVYALSGLAAGSYRITRVFPAGYKLSNSATGYVTVVADAGQTVAGVNLGTRTV